jgi:hypothetical protein
MSIINVKGVVLVGALCAISSVWAEEGGNTPALAKAVTLVKGSQFKTVSEPLE